MRREINYNRNGFHPFYGAASIRRNTRLYKRGMIKEENGRKDEVRVERESKLLKVLSNGLSKHGKRYIKRHPKKNKVY